MSEAIENIKQAFSTAIEIANIYINTLWSQDKKKAKPIHDKLQAAFDLHRESITEFQAEIERLKEESRWIPVDDMPNSLMALPVPTETEWKTSYYALEDCAEIPKIMTAEQIWLVEDSDVTHWKPIILPEQALKNKGGGQEGEMARCPCGGKLEGIGYNIDKEKGVVFECKKCGAQLLLEDKIWKQVCKSGGVTE